VLYINTSHNIKLELRTRADKEENNIKRGATDNALLPNMLMGVTWIVTGDSVNLPQNFCTCMIASCRKAVVNYSKPVLFKPQSRQYLQQQIKPLCRDWVWCFVQGKEERV
jgi:hypothetical protein